MCLPPRHPPPTHTKVFQLMKQSAGAGYTQMWALSRWARVQVLFMGFHMESIEPFNSSLRIFIFLEKNIFWVFGFKKQKGHWKITSDHVESFYQLLQMVSSMKNYTTSNWWWEGLCLIKALLEEGFSSQISSLNSCILLTNFKDGILLSRSFHNK